MISTFKKTDFCAHFTQSELRLQLVFCKQDATEVESSPQGGRSSQELDDLHLSRIAMDFGRPI